MFFKLFASTVLKMLLGKQNKKSFNIGITLVSKLKRNLKSLQFLF